MDKNKVKNCARVVNIDVSRDGKQVDMETAVAVSKTVVAGPTDRGTAQGPPGGKPSPSSQRPPPPGGL